MSSAQALYDTLVRPGRAMPQVAESARFLPALVAATAVALVFAAVAVPRFDFGKAALDALDRRPDAAQMTQHQREDVVATAHKVGAVAGYAGSALGPTLFALGAAVALWLGLKLAGGTPAFRPTFAVASFAQLPGAVHQLLLLPAVLRSGPIDPTLVPRLLPSSAGALLPAGAAGPGASFLFALDLFSLWTVALMALGMASAARVSRGRAVATTVLVWLAWVAVFKVALPQLGGAR
ncbi:MAG TPA: YIP1 family protein [Anaeromyxobacteraceae bacterium]